MVNEHFANLWNKMHETQYAKCWLSILQNASQCLFAFQMLSVLDILLVKSMFAICKDKVKFFF